MTFRFPVKASPIHLTWWNDQGGIGVSAYTDDMANPYIGLYPLDKDGDTLGLPVYFDRARLMARVVVSTAHNKPVIAFIDAEVTAHGLDLRLALSSTVSASVTPYHQWAKWGETYDHYRPLKQ